MKEVLVAIAVVLFGAFGVGYIIDAIQAKNTVDTITEKAENIGSEPIITDQEAKIEFVSGCVGESQGLDSNSAYCTCMYERLREVYSVNQLLNISLTMTDTELQAFMQPYATRCARETWGVELL